MSWQQMEDPRETNSASLAGQKIYPRSRSMSPWRLILGIISLLVWLAGLLIVVVFVLSAPTRMVSSSSNSSKVVIENLGPPTGLILLFGACFLIFTAILLAINFFIYRRR